MSIIWVPKFKIIEPREPVGLASRVKGEVRLKVYKEGVKEPRVDTGWFSNLILDGGLDLLGNNNIASCATRCFVGSSNTAPSASQTSLGSAIASTTSTFSSNDYAVEGTYGVDARKTVTLFKEFSTGVAAGTIREVGFTTNSDNTGSNLFARALVTDGDGNPTDIVVLSDEILQVSYKISIYFPTEDIEGSFDMSGSEIGYIARVPNVSGASNTDFINLYGNGSFGSTAQSGGTFGAIGVSPSGGNSASLGGATSAAYTNGNYYRDCTISSSLTQGNVTGGSFDIIRVNTTQNGSPTWKFQLDTPIPKDNTKVMSLNFRFAWARKT